MPSSSIKNGTRKYKTGIVTNNQYLIFPNRKENVFSRIAVGTQIKIKEPIDKKL